MRILIFHAFLLRILSSSILPRIAYDIIGRRIKGVREKLGNYFTGYQGLCQGMERSPTGHEAGLHLPVFWTCHLSPMDFRFRWLCEFHRQKDKTFWFVDGWIDSFTSPVRTESMGFGMILFIAHIGRRPWERGIAGRRARHPDHGH